MSLNNLHQKKEFIIELGRILHTLNKASVYRAVVRENPWFIPESVDLALRAWEKALTSNQVNKWLSNYSDIDLPSHPADILIVMAGNLPLVGLHDLLCTIIAGHRSLIKMSTKDQVLLQLILSRMELQFKDLTDWILPVSKLPSSPAAVIASGSNETKAYFNELYRGTPSILRGHRNSIAVLNGNESDEQLRNLRHDLLAYHGLGCRNVTQILAPSEKLIEYLAKLHEGMTEQPVYKGYLNNFKQQQIIARMNKQFHHLAGQYLLIESSSLSSPMSVVHYQIYDQESDVNQFMISNRDQIQCCVSQERYASLDPTPFGHAQFPALDDYADHIDTITFLQNV